MNVVLLIRCSEKGIMSEPEEDFQCNGLGYIECFCGGDLCVCDNYGEIPCGGCDACEPSDEDFYDD